MAYGMNKERAHREVHLDHLSDWLLARPTFVGAVHARLESHGLEAFGPLLKMTHDELGHAVTGISSHTHTGFSKWFDELLAEEISQNDFLRGPGLPRPRPDVRFNKMIGLVVLKSPWWERSATSVRQQINRNRAAREVLEG